jgi:hypothetical protein
MTIMPRRKLEGQPPRRRGPVTRFPDKVRVPFALQLPADLHFKLKRTADRLHLKRGDVLCELLTQYADHLSLPSAP